MLGDLLEGGDFGFGVLVGLLWVFEGEPLIGSFLDAFGVVAALQDVHQIIDSSLFEIVHIKHLLHRKYLGILFHYLFDEDVADLMHRYFVFGEGGIFELASWGLDDDSWCRETAIARFLQGC